jgi:putative ATPase
MLWFQSNSSIFIGSEKQSMNHLPPLAERMRPDRLDEFVGQEHLIEKGSVLQMSIRQGRLPSMIFWGPPGVGKTTLAKIISVQFKIPFYTLSAINSGVKDIRDVFDQVKKQGLFGGNHALLFIDEIHRFSKAQQDSLLGAVENGLITLIGATTENPSFEVIPALLSRCQVYTLYHLEEKHLEQLLQLALTRDEVLKKRTFNVRETNALFRFSGGDARRLFNVLELVVNTQTEDPVQITNNLVTKLVQENPAWYDKTGEQHYDIISAFIKSIRGSDPNAGVYYLARMIEGGEDPKFIARRLVILASEDIGNANPNALVLAQSCFDAINQVGWPEGRIMLSQTVIYLATSPKSNASYEAIDKAIDFVKKTGDLPIPLHLRNAPTLLMKELDYGKNYAYPHAFDGNFIEQEYLPEKAKGTVFYEPGNNSKEASIRTFLSRIWKKKYGY